MPRYMNEMPLTAAPDFLFQQIQQYLVSEGFEYVRYDNEDVFKKGNGILTAPSFFKVTFPNGTVRLEAWIKYALFPGVYIGEYGTTGFVGAAAKGPMKKRIAQIEAMIMAQTGGASAYAPIPPQPDMNAAFSGNGQPESGIRCDACGTMLPPGTVFCTNCGNPVSAAATPTPDGSPDAAKALYDGATIGPASFGQAPIPPQPDANAAFSGNGQPESGIRCDACGTMLPPGTVFCTNCGKPVPPAATPTPDGSPDAAKALYDGATIGPASFGQSPIPPQPDANAAFSGNGQPESGICCDACGTMLPPGTVFCTNCGKPVPPQMSGGSPYTANAPYNNPQFIPPYGNQPPMPPAGQFVSRKDFVNHYAPPSLNKAIMAIAILCYVCAGLTFVVALFGNFLNIIDAAILAGLALGLQLTKHRGFAIGILVLSIVECVIAVAFAGIPPFWWLFAGIGAVKTTADLEKQYNQFTASQNGPQM